MEIQFLAERFYDYSFHIRGYTKATIKRYKYVLGFYQRYASVQNIEEITEASIREFFLYGRSQRNWKARTFLVFHTSLQAFFKWCILQGYIPKNPVTDFEKPKVEKVLPVKLSQRDAFRILETAYNYPYNNRFLQCRNHAIFAVLIFAGLRKQELLSLKYSDVDITNLSIFVQQGKGNKDRVIPMSYTLAESLKRYLDERKKLNKTCPEFFTSLPRNNGYSDSGFRRLIALINTASGVAFSAHKLRHTFATLMLEGGCDIYSLSRMMGHSDIKTTTIYLYASVEHLRAQITKHPMNYI